MGGTGAVDDGDGVFHDDDGSADDGDCRIVNGAVDAATSRISFDQVYQDGATTRWEAVYDRETDTLVSGTWSGECDGTFEVRRFSEADAKERLVGYRMLSTKPVAVSTGWGTDEEPLGCLAVGSAAVSSSAIQLDENGREWVELLVKPEPEAGEGRARGKVQKACWTVQGKCRLLGRRCWTGVGLMLY